jgi:hypothetical protein
VYGRRCNAEQLEHSVWITEAEDLIGGIFSRDVPVGKTIADAATVRDGTRFYVEVDNETMTTKQMQRKWELYGSHVAGFILVICHTKTRMRRLMRGAEEVREIAFFTRFRWLRSTRVKKPWVDLSFRRIGI